MRTLGERIHLSINSVPLWSLTASFMFLPRRLRVSHHTDYLVPDKGRSLHGLRFCQARPRVTSVCQSSSGGIKKN